MKRSGKTVTHHARAHLLTNSMVAFVSLVKAGMGIARLSSTLVGEEQKKGVLVAVLPDYEAAYPHNEALAIWFAYADRNVLKRTRLVMDFIEAHLP